MRIFLILTLLISMQSFGQNPTNYQYRTVRERLLAMMADSTFHLPRYNGVPSGVRTGSSTHSGALGADTLNNRIYFWSDYVWHRLANYSDLSAYVLYTDTATMLTPYLRGATEGYGIDITGSQHKTWTLDSATVFPHIRATISSGSGTINSGTTGKPAYYTGATSLDDFIAIDYATSGTNMLLTTQNTTDVGLNIKGQSSQSANYLNISTSAGTGDLAFINASGEMIFGGNTDAGVYDLQINDGLWVNNVSAAAGNGLVLSPGTTISSGFVIQNNGGGEWILAALNATSLKMFTSSSPIYISPGGTDKAIFLSGGGMTQPEQAAPSTPASGHTVIYPKSDGLIYAKDDAGVETKLSNVAGATPGIDDVLAIGQDLTANRTIEINTNTLSFDKGVVNFKNTALSATASVNIDAYNSSYGVINVTNTAGNQSAKLQPGLVQIIGDEFNNSIQFQNGTTGSKTIQLFPPRDADFSGSSDLYLQNKSGYVAVSGQGADVPSLTGAIALGSDGTCFEITGTNAITLISNVGWKNGVEVTLIFTSTASLTDGTANSGTDIGFELAANANFTASADDTITLILCEIGGTQRWREKCRSVN